MKIKKKGTIIEEKVNIVIIFTYLVEHGKLGNRKKMSFVDFIPNYFLEKP